MSVRPLAVRAAARTLGGPPREIRAMVAPFKNEPFTDFARPENRGAFEDALGERRADERT